MALGATVRARLGRLEPTAIGMYRSLFIDLDDLAVTTASVAPDARRILEIGCGDGAMAAALLTQLPGATLLGIDPGMAEPGRMFAGDRSRVRFEKVLTGELLARGEEPFDLVLLVDVLHHVADGDRPQVLADAAALTAPGGTLVVKEWDQRNGPTNVAFLADRYVSGDATVRFMPPDELDGMIAPHVAGWAKTCEARIPPRRANRFLAFRRPAS